MKGTVFHLNPEGLHRNPAFSQVITTSGHTRTIYVGGQNAVEPSGAIAGKGDIGVQAKQVGRNLQVSLAAANAGIEHVVKGTIYVVQGQPLGPAMGAFSASSWSTAEASDHLSPVRSSARPSRLSPRSGSHRDRSR